METQASLWHGNLSWLNNHVEFITVENRVEPLTPGQVFTCGRWALCKVVEDGWQWEWDNPETTNGGW